MKRINYILVFIVSVCLVACSNVSQPPSPEQPKPPTEEPVPEISYQDELCTLLPGDIGLKQQFNGTAEYGHQLKLQYIQNNNNSGIKYQFEGLMDDARGDGESTRMFDLAYIVTQDSIIEEIYNHDPYNRLDNPRLLNSIIPNKVVLKGPLEDGNIWSESFEYNGNTYMAVNTLAIKTTENGETQYEVSTIVENIDNYLNHTYKEVRTFEARKGMVSFSNLENLTLYDDEFVERHPEEETYLFGYELSEAPSYFEQLKKLLPSSSGGVQNYNGYAEYGHILTLDSISLTHGPQMVYQYSGVMNDGMGDDDETRTFDLKYFISNDEITEQIKNRDPHNLLGNDALLNSIIPNKIVIKAPLVDGNTWSEVFEYKSQPYKALNTLRLQTSESGTLLYVVETIVEDIEDYINQTYKETRIYEEGKGMISFENIYSLNQFDNTYVEQHPEEEFYLFGYGLSE